MASGMKGTKGVGVKFTTHKGVDVAASKLVGPLADAAGKQVDTNDVHRRAHLIGLVALRSCMGCSAGVPCNLHDEAGLLSVLGIEPPKPQKPATTEGFQATVDLYDRLYREARGHKPSWSAAVCAEVKRALDTHGVEVMREAIEGAFGDHGFWRSKVTLRQIMKDPDRFRGLSASSGTRGMGTGQREGACT